MYRSFIGDEGQAITRYTGCKRNQSWRIILMTDDEKGEYKIQVGKRGMTNEVEDKNW